MKLRTRSSRSFIIALMACFDGMTSLHNMKGLERGGEEVADIFGVLALEEYEVVCLSALFDDAFM